MATYRVVPIADGATNRQHWKVTRNGGHVKSHTTKNAAENRARREASAGDRIIVHRTDGTVQKVIDGGTASRRSGSSSSDDGGIFGAVWDWGDENSLL